MDKHVETQRLHRFEFSTLWSLPSKIIPPKFCLPKSYCQRAPSATLQIPWKSEHFIDTKQWKVMFLQHMLHVQRIIPTIVTLDLTTGAFSHLQQTMKIFFGQWLELEVFWIIVELLQQLYCGLIGLTIFCLVFLLFHLLELLLWFCNSVIACRTVGTGSFPFLVAFWEEKLHYPKLPGIPLEEF